MIILRAKYSDGNAFLDAYDSKFPNGGIFIPTRKKLELAKSLIVDVRFPELRNQILIRGIVAWRRGGQRRTKLRAGLGVEFLASERRKHDFLLGVAQGQVVDIVQRKHRRLPVKIRVDWREKSSSERQISSIDDIGQGGAFVRTTKFLPVGSAVILEITAPGGQRQIPIEGNVAWTCHTTGEEGMGVEFRCRDLGGSRLLKELIRRLEHGDQQLVRVG